MLVHPSGLDPSGRHLRFLTARLREHHRAIGSRWRRPDAGRQALTALAHLRHGHPYAQLAAGFGIATTTAYRYITEAVETLAALAPSLAEAVRTASSKAFVLLDGALLPTGRTVADRPFCSGKHKEHGMNPRTRSRPRLRGPARPKRPPIRKKSSSGSPSHALIGDSSNMSVTCSNQLTNMQKTHSFMDTVHKSVLSLGHPATLHTSRPLTGPDTEVRLECQGLSRNRWSCAAEFRAGSRAPGSSPGIDAQIPHVPVEPCPVRAVCVLAGGEARPAGDCGRGSVLRLYPDHSLLRSLTRRTSGDQDDRAGGQAAPLPRALAAGVDGRHRAGRRWMPWPTAHTVLSAAEQGEAPMQTLSVELTGPGL